MFVMSMNLMNMVFQDYIDKFRMTFIDDILVYSNIYEEHEKYLRFVEAKRETLIFHVFKIKFWLDKVTLFYHSAYIQGEKT